MHQVEKVPALLAERGQQRRARRLGRAARDSAGTRASRPRHVSPVLAARGEQEEMDVDVLREPAEAVQVRRRQGRDAEDRHATRERPRRRRLRQRAERGILDPGTMRLGGARDERAPERRLPPLVGARLPARDPLRAIDEVLVEEVRDARGELVAAALVGGAQVRAERLEPRSVVQAVQDRPQVPDRHPALERVGLRDVRQHAAKRVPQEAAGKREADVRRHAERAREAERQPARHPRALHDDDLGLEGRRRRLANERDQPADEVFQIVAAQDGEHGRINRPGGGRCRAGAAGTRAVRPVRRLDPSIRPFPAAPTHRPSWHRPCQQGQQGRSGR